MASEEAATHSDSEEGEVDTEAVESQRQTCPALFAAHDGACSVGMNLQALVDERERVKQLSDPQVF